MTGALVPYPSQGEAPAFTFEEDDGTGATFATGQDGTANGAIVVKPNLTTGRGTITKTYAAETDFTVYDASAVGTDDDFIEFYLYVAEPTGLLSVDLMIDVNATPTNRFQADYYFHSVKADDLTDLSQRNLLSGNYTAQGPTRSRVLANAPATGAAVSRVRTDKPVGNAGWSRIQIRRGDMLRVGNTSGKDWKTVKAIRLVITTSSAPEIRIDAIRIVQAPIFGNYKWCYVLAYNTGTYVAKSAPSALSAETHLQSAGATVTVPADGSRDSQANEIWLYRMGEHLDAFYRVQVKTGVSGTGTVAITDALSDEDALITNIKLETDNAVPPDTIIDIEGPYYDRLFALTATTLYPSRRLNPESFAAGQAITVSGADETAYWVRKALGGLYIGTSKDIYLLDGTGAELPDGTIDFSLRPLNVDHPPISEAVAQEGNLMVYLADDGWRAMGGAGSTSLSGPTSLLYRGQARHGVSAVNVTGRFRAAIAKGQLVAITPEGGSTTSSTVLYRYVFATQQWYRHVYTSNWRCVAREESGTLIASSDAGTVWVLDTGTQDGSSDIAVTMWTKADDDGLPFQRKDPGDLRVRADTGGASASVALHLDGSAVAASTKTVTQSGMGVSAFDLSALAVFKQIQLRITCTGSTFRLYDFGLGYRERPVPMMGRVMESNGGYAGEKVITGFKLKLCTIGAARTLTPYLDNVATAQTFSVTTDSAEAATVLLQFTAAKTATDIAWSSDGDVELYEWEPLVLYQLPVRVKVFENKPMVPSAVRRRWGGFTLQIDTHGAAVTLTPVLDGVDQTTLTTTSSDLLGKTLTFNAIVGRDLWCRVTGATPFTPHTVTPIILETLPQAFKGQTARNTFGYPGEKTMSGIQVRLCTVGIARTVTPVLDGVDQTAAAVTTGTDDPDELTIAFSSPQDAADIALLFSGDVELYDWQPIVTAKRPLGITAWDSGPLDLGRGDLVWIREVRMKVRASAAIVVTPYFDGCSFPSVTLPITSNAGQDAVLIVPVGRAYKGRAPRFVLTSTGRFYPYWVEFMERETQVARQKKPVRVPLGLGGQVSA